MGAVTPVWWLSFADDEGHLGVILVDGDAPLPDVLGELEDLNPGGAVCAILRDVESIPDAENRALIMRTPRRTLLKRADLEALGYDDFVDGEGNEK